MLEAGCDRVVVVVGAAAEAVADAVGGTGARGRHGTDWEEGMGASLRAGLSAPRARRPTTSRSSPSSTCPTSRPRSWPGCWPPAQGDGRAALARAAYDGVPGHPVAIGRDHWAAVAATARGDRGARDHLRATPHLLVECGDLATGRDVDTAEDLRRGMMGP